jgi:ankyrin repeat protein
MSMNASGDVVSEILETGNVVNAQFEDGSTALMIACRKGDIHIAKILLCAQADPHIADSKGRYPLAVAAYGGNLDLVKALVEAKADISFAPHGSLPAIHFAMMSKQHHITSYLHKTLEEERNTSISTSNSTDDSE